MGYRTYIAEIPKREYNKIKSMTVQELIEFYNIERNNDQDDDEFGYWYKGVHDYGKELYEFGKYTDFNPPKKSMKPFFKNKELQKRYDEDYDFFIVTKEFLAYIIDSYKQRIVNYYNDMTEPFFGKGKFANEPSEFLNTIKTEYHFGEMDDDHTFDFSKITQEEKNAFWKILEHIRSFKPEWTYLTPYDLEKGESICKSWKFEYAIFELVRIYKSFDWKKKVMIYYGY